MTFIRLAFRILLTLLIVLVLIGLVLPSSAQVSRTLLIDAPVEAVFPHVNNMRRFHAWSPWTNVDPSTRYVFEGPEAGVGASMRWYSGEEGIGEGSQRITASEADQRVETSLEFGDKGEGVATFELTPLDGGTEIRWTFSTEFGWDIFGRYVGLLLDNMIGTAYDRGLRTLKERLEAAQPIGASAGGPASGVSPADR